MRNIEQQRYHQMKKAAIRIQVIPEGGGILFGLFLCCCCGGLVGWLWLVGLV